MGPKKIIELVELVAKVYGGGKTVWQWSVKNGYAGYREPKQLAHAPRRVVSIF